MRLPSPNTKIHRIFGYLLEGKSLNFIEAQQLLHDRSLHSTISSLQNEYEIQISRRIEVISGYQGYQTRCMHYWIDLKERQRIKLLLNIAA